jgi:Ca-activated chloride channel family protein
LNDSQGASLAVLAMLPEGVGSHGIDQLSIPVQQVSVDDTDIVALDRLLSAAYRRALAEKSDQPWDDRGWLLAWPAALLALFWFRRGWTMRWGIAAFAMVMVNASQARADGLADWFLTPDQQGQIAFDKHHFDKAGAMFVEPMHKAYALYRDGKYAGVVETVASLETPDASFLSGMAHIKDRGYRDAIADFETTLKRDPDFPGARKNLELAKKILDYVENAREQSDTGEHTGEGADDVVFDNKEAKGADTEIKGRDDGPRLLTADQWMNAVDTNTADFLRQRFAIEAARR